MSKKCLLARGWTSTLIEKWLGPFDYTPHDFDPRATRYWDTDRVVKVEINPLWLSAQEKAEKQSKNRKKYHAQKVDEAKAILARVEDREKKAREKHGRRPD
jgi:hypothetical protein